MLNKGGQLGEAGIKKSGDIAATGPAEN